jgi:hypothetical protein
MSTNIECSPSTVGVASTATIAPMIIGGTKTLVDFVGGGDGNFYALNPDNGAFIWEQCFGDGRIFAAVTVAPGIVSMPLASSLEENNKHNKRFRYKSLRRLRPESPYNFSDTLCFYGWNTGSSWL